MELNHSMMTKEEYFAIAAKLCDELQVQNNAGKSAILLAARINRLPDVKFITRNP